MEVGILFYYTFYVPVIVHQDGLLQSPFLTSFNFVAAKLRAAEREKEREI